MKTQLTNKEMANTIKETFAAIPNKQVIVGIYLKTVGHKYVTLVNTWDTTTLEKIPIQEFYNQHFPHLKDIRV